MERRVNFLILLGLLLGLVSTLPKKGDWDIYSFHINSTVTSRYATTVIKSRVANRMEESKEIEFHVRIPKNAFISKFRMFMDGEVYDGVVKAKEQAEHQYTAAVSRGQSAGIVSSVGRTLEEFKTSVTVAAHKKVTFELTYEELLKRRLGKYELQIFARPMQPVKDFKVDVHIHEDAGLQFIEVKGGLSTKELANAIAETVTDQQAWVNFYPTVDQQKVCDSCSEDGLNGDLIIFYDVKREVPFGDIQTRDGYFVHHFAPSSLPRIPKNVVFVIDQSGSMHGRKMHQTRIALIHILSDLSEDDFFGLITFDSEIFHWKRELVQATSANIEQAKRFAEHIEDRGSTDINRAVLEGTRMLNVHPREDSASILILLTDGDPTSGETNPEKIRANVKKAIAGKFPLYCLGFGFDVNFEILEKMSLDNNGLARRIYEDSDANLQLQGFYEEVATPLLTDVTMIYTGGSNLTQTNFSQYYNGSEIVVAGVITDNNIESFTPEVVALSRNTRVTFSRPNTTTESIVMAPVDRIQRVWAYLTVKQLMEKELQLSGPEKNKVKKEAMDLSLKYSFVTSLTSMVVTKPPGEDSAVLHKPKEGEAPAMPLIPTLNRARGGAVGTSLSVQHHGHVLHRLASPAGGAFHPVSRFSPPPLAPRIGFFSPPAPPGLPRFSDIPGPPGPPPLPGLHGIAGPPADPDHLGFPLVLNKRRHFSSSQVQVTDSREADYVAFDMDSIMVHATMIPDTTTTTTKAPSTQRFLLRPERLTLPLCFDLPASVNVTLLRHPGRGLDIKGMIGTETNGGFTHISLHAQHDTSIEVDTDGVSVKQGLTLARYSEQTQITVGSLTVIINDKEVIVLAGEVRFVILIHEISGRKFLWPVLRQMPLDDKAEGVLFYNNGDFEEEERPDIGSTSVKIKGNLIPVRRSIATDYSFPVALTADCWFLAAHSALQRPASDFYN
ncbi:inter-alpha-trypsin inhibitor heavy chain H3-like [Boleophthalmus pectinirostris]|uniref:inter-alpha-trypsin inhibitor heavy chain H3-like n=1 Tax=Boleophthalmus pectinirostris TaxID=150288 RepID=UPI000A1C54BF|nr:inter-alpha-trypsin inhibitor heavy chain H3-like [Boleophthalmus pectinirostris]